jgi:poly(ADP-ribose) glycohydrolase
LTITRRKLQGKSNEWWRNRQTQLLQHVQILSTGSIEDASEMVQIDFANKYIGGGVLGNGLVQEEIRFLQFPEMIVTRLLCERLDDDEAVLVVGAERFNETQGYARTFKFTGNFSDNTPT